MRKSEGDPLLRAQSRPVGRNCPERTIVTVTRSLNTLGLVCCRIPASQYAAGVLPWKSVDAGNLRSRIENKGREESTRYVYMRWRDVTPAVQYRPAARSNFIDSLWAGPRHGFLYTHIFVAAKRKSEFESKRKEIYILMIKIDFWNYENSILYIYIYLIS